jgi:periplasmic protein TonB
MANGYLSLDKPWESRGTWSWGLLGSLAIHALIIAAVLLAFQDRPPKPRVVVPVESVTLVPYRPGLQGGGGHPGPVTRAKPAPLKPAPVPVPAKPKAKPKPRPKHKPKRVLPPPLPTKAPAIPLPAPATVTSKAPAAPAGAISRTSQAFRGAGSHAGTGGGGRGGGRGTGTGGGSGLGHGRGSGSGSALQGYLRDIRRLLEQHKNYPWLARRRNLQGVVVLVFTVTAGGQIESYRVSRSSGQDLLDEASKATIRRVGKFPPFPAALKRRKLTVEIPLAFRLKTY